MNTRTIKAVLLSSLCVVSGQSASAKEAARSAVVAATVSVLPASAESRPFLDQAERMTASGYVQEEFVLSGKANVYTWTGSGHDVKVIAGPSDYATRILVWRPRDAKKFSGNVEVNVLNGSGMVDAGRPTDFHRMIDQGDVWIGITTKAVTAKALQRFDPVRYAALNWTSPVKDRCPYPTIIPAYMVGGQIALEAMAKAGMAGSLPDTEDGLVWDMLGQLGQLLKSSQRDKILPGFGRPWLYMTGVSQSSLVLRTFALAFHDRYRKADGKPVYDGYLGVVGPALFRLNQCENDVPLGDARQKFSSLDVPFVSMSSEGEMWEGGFTHQPDNISPRGGWVTYEVAGGSHGAGETPGLKDVVSFSAPPADLERSGMPNRTAMSGAATGNLMPAGAKRNDMPWAPLARGAYHNLQLWVRKGVVPPQAAQIEMDATGAIKRDTFGNALGGVRTPYVDVPTSSHTGYLTAGGFGGVMGARKPLPDDTLKQLYPETSTYVSKFSAATDRMVAEQWISKEDGQAMKQAASDTPMTN